MNAVVPFPTSAEKTFGEQFRAFRSSATGAELGSLRDEAYAAFSANGLPHRRIEAWHYTDLRGIVREGLPLAPLPGGAILARASAALAALPQGSHTRIVLVDGVFLSDLSTLGKTASGVTVRTVFGALDRDPLPDDLVAAERLGSVESIVSLNAAFLQGGVMVDVAAGASIAEPIEIVAFASGDAPSAAYARHYVRIGQGASASFTERHVALGAARAQSNHVMVLSIGDGSTLDHAAVVSDLGVQTLHIGSLLVRLGADAKFLSSTLIATGGVTRRQAYLEFAGPHSKAHFRGVSLLDGKCHADTTLVVTHTAPHCESRELYKHILDGESTGVYQGKVVVAPGAQKTDGKMLSKAVFLDEGSAMYNKPELEIFADDVVCGHGATAGALDENQLFYLRARGVPLKEAQALLLEAFADEAIEDVADKALRAELAERISRWLRQRGT